MTEYEQLSFLNEKEELLYCVYKHIFPDGKVYVGKTRNTPYHRWTSGTRYEGQAAISNAIDSVGGYDDFIANVKHFVLSLKDDMPVWLLWDRTMRYCDTNIFTFDDADCYEINFIRLYNADNPAFGLNGNSGGDRGFSFNDDSKKRMSDAVIGKYCGEKNGFYDKHHSDETRAVLSEKAKGRTGEKNSFYKHHHSEETKGVLSEKAQGRTGEKNSFYKHHHSEETRAVLSEKAQGRTHTEETKRKMSRSRMGVPHKGNPVYQYSLEGELVGVFDSQIAAAREVGVSKAVFERALRNGAPCGGYTWKRQGGAKQ